MGSVSSQDQQEETKPILIDGLNHKGKLETPGLISVDAIRRGVGAAPNTTDAVSDQY